MLRRMASPSPAASANSTSSASMALKRSCMVPPEVARPALAASRAPREQGEWCGYGALGRRGPDGPRWWEPAPRSGPPRGRAAPTPTSRPCRAASASPGVPGGPAGRLPPHRWPSRGTRRRWPPVPRACGRRGSSDAHPGILAPDEGQAPLRVVAPRQVVGVLGHVAAESVVACQLDLDDELLTARRPVVLVQVRADAAVPLGVLVVQAGYHVQLPAPRRVAHVGYGVDPNLGGVRMPQVVHRLGDL